MLCTSEFKLKMYSFLGFSIFFPDAKFVLRLLHIQTNGIYGHSIFCFKKKEITNHLATFISPFAHTFGGMGIS